MRGERDAVNVQPALKLQLIGRFAPFDWAKAEAKDLEGCYFTRRMILLKDLPAEVMAFDRRPVTGPQEAER